MLETYGVELIGARIDAIRPPRTAAVQGRDARDRARRFPRRASRTRSTRRWTSPSRVGYPMIVRPSFILGGGGTGIAHDADEFAAIAAHGLAASPVSEILIERVGRGLEGVRARGDARPRRQRASSSARSRTSTRWACTPATRSRSLPRRPSPTSSTRRCATPRSRASAASASTPADRTSSSRSNPLDGEMIVIEMNPRVSRSAPRSASKATGFPIAKIAARLAVGYTLDEIRNDITRETPASFEPTIDYVVTKIPRWAFEKLPGADAGARHDDAVGRRGDGDRPHVPRVAAEGAALARDRAGSGSTAIPPKPCSTRIDRRGARARRRRVPTPERLFEVEAALRRGVTVERLARGRPASTRGSSTRSCRLSRRATSLAEHRPRGHDAARDGSDAKQLGFSDAQLAYLWGVDEEGTCARARRAAGVRVTYKTVDTCAAEFAARDAVSLRHLRRRGRGRAARPPRGRDPRQRPEPHRPGRRVRLLLRARALRARRTPATRR